MDNQPSCGVDEGEVAATRVASADLSNEKEADLMAETCKESAEGFQSKISHEDSKVVIDEKTNFTWEHFFTKHCGILPADALVYEASLIAHRMDPVDTLLESLHLIIEYGRIPVGDKLKITKAIQRAQDALESRAKGLENAKKTFGLESYNDLDATVILSLAGGDTDDHIGWGIEQWEENKKELERMMSFAILKDPQAYAMGAAFARKTKDPVFQLLQHLGYKTFKYTHGKDTSNTSVPARPSSSDPLINEILFGNLSFGSSEELVPNESTRLMFS